MQKKTDPAVELAARTIQSQPWNLSHWWKILVFSAVRVRHECCFRKWSEPYPGTVGDRQDFICGECNLRGPIERVPNLYTGAEETREPFDLGFCPLDPLCNGERLKPVSCAAVFADEVDRFCNSLEEVLEPNRHGRIPWAKAQEAYWAFSHFKKHLPDWDPTGTYGGAFERWEEECARENLPPWGPEGPPEPVPLIDRVRQEREEALTGAQRAYDKIMVPAARALQQALAEAERVRHEVRRVLFRGHPDEVVRLCHSVPPEVVHRLACEERAAQRAAQEKSNREYAAKHPTFPRSQHTGDSAGQPASQTQADPSRPAFSEEEAAAHYYLEATSRRSFAKAEGAAYRKYGKALARAERAYARAMAASAPSRTATAKEEGAWEALTQLAYRLTELGKRVDQAIGRFRTLDVTEPKDSTASMKREVRKDLGLPAKKMPPPRRGPREENRKRYREVMKLAAKDDLTIKEIAYQTGTNYHTARRWILESRHPLD